MDRRTTSEPRTAATLSLAERRELHAASSAALVGQDAVLFQCPTAELGPLVGDLAEQRARVEAQLVAVVAEAERRGVVAASQAATTRAWVADQGWHVRGQAATIAKAAALLRRPDLTAVAEQILSTDVDLATAVSVGAEFDKVAAKLPEQIPAGEVLAQYLGIGADHGPVGVRQLTKELISRWAEDGELDEHESRCRRQVELSAGRECATGLWDYQLRLDAEGRAVLEASIGRLSAPRFDTETKVPDQRPVGLRRGEALVEVLRRSAAAGEQSSPAPKAVVHVTIDYGALLGMVRQAWDGIVDAAGAAVRATLGGSRHRAAGHHATGGEDAGCGDTACGGGACGDTACGDAACGEGSDGEVLDVARVAAQAAARAGVVVGTRAAGTLLGVHTLRRLACDATIIPMVLGSNGEVLELGRAVRLFTAAQIRALWQRDRHCTFPGCDAPADWTDAHHLIHWIDGGRTDLDNAALLCQRHHTIVHRDRLAGRVINGHVEWDLRANSYRPPDRTAPPGARTANHVLAMRN